MKPKELSDAMLAVICRRVFKMRDAKESLEDTAEALDLTPDEMLDILEEAQERGLIEVSP